MVTKNIFDQFDDPSPAPTRDTSLSSSGNVFDSIADGNMQIEPEEQDIIARTTSLKVNTPESFGLTEIPGSFVKGAAAQLASFPQRIGTSLTETGELIQSTGAEGAVAVGKESFMRRMANDMLADDGDLPDLWDFTYNLLAAEKDALVSAVAGQQGASSVIRAGSVLTEGNRELIRQLNLTPDRKDGVAYQFGAGFGSLAEQVFLTVATKSPKIAAANMAVLVNSTEYEEARSAGLTPQQAARQASRSATASAAVEAAGGAFLLKTLKGSSYVGRTVKSLAGQAAEEAAQDGIILSLRNEAGVADLSATDIVESMAFSALVGAVAGAPIMALTSAVAGRGERAGLQREAARYMAEKIVNRKDDLTDAATLVINKEASGLGTDPARFSEAKTAVDQVIADKERQRTEQLAQREEQQVQQDQEIRETRAEAETKLDNTVSNIEQVAATLSPEVKQLVDDKISLLKARRKATRTGRTQKSRDGSRQALAEINLTLSEVDAALRDAGVDEAKIKNIESLRREFVKQQTLAERTAERAERLRAVTQQESASEPSALDADTQQIREAKKAGVLRRATTGTSDFFGGVMELGSDIFTPVSTRLGKIDASLKDALRKYTYETGLRLTEDKRVIEPFVNKASAVMTPEDYAALDFLLKNQASDKVDVLLDKYDMREDFLAVRDRLDNIFDEAQQVGLDMNYTVDYFPRQVKHSKVSEYLAYLEGTENWSEIRSALAEKDPNGMMTDEEKADFINNYLRGFRSSRIQLQRSGFTKERSVDYITPEMNEFYESSAQALIRYVDGMRYGIESRKFFGQGEDGQVNIGKYVQDLIAEGSIDAKNEQEIKKILSAVIDQRGTSGPVTWAKNANYIAVMGSPISAVTQIGDLAFSLYKNGVYNTLSSLPRAIVRRSIVTKEDLGIDHILQEFEGNTKSAAALRKTFKWVGLEYMDNIGKEVFAASTQKQLKKQIRKNDKELNAELERVFGAEADSVKSDILNDRMTENAKYMLFARLSDVQPVSLAEMPATYLKSGNGRVFYMLKSYTLRLLDFHRREWIDMIASGEPKKVVKGLGNAMRISTALLLTGISADAIKDFLLGKPFDLNDTVMDNMFKIFGLNNYTVMKAKRDGLGETAFDTLVNIPFFTTFGNLTSDAWNIPTGDRKLKDAETFQNVPVGGKMYYWWWGGGATKKNKGKNAKALSTL